jgi:hypothetical protein
MLPHKILWYRILKGSHGTVKVKRTLRKRF